MFTLQEEREKWTMMIIKMCEWVCVCTVQEWVTRKERKKVVNGIAIVWVSREEIKREKRNNESNTNSV